MKFQLSGLEQNYSAGQFRYRLFAFVNSTPKFTRFIQALTPKAAVGKDSKEAQTKGLGFFVVGLRPVRFINALIYDHERRATLQPF